MIICSSSVIPKGVCDMPLPEVRFTVKKKCLGYQLNITAFVNTSSCLFKTANTAELIYAYMCLHKLEAMFVDGCILRLC